ncbi:Rad60-SLD domain-containing protein [Mycena kentingensis (nom. inval.)]|nr:Rad60-SLD domain-containing protein [Mycena kentingensis (nom. inval.)]
MSESSRKINILVEFSGHSLTFNYNRSKPLEKILVKFCESFDLDRKNLRFNYDGANIRGEASADDMKMEMDEDGSPPVIDGQMFQQGGGARMGE